MIPTTPKQYAARDTIALDKAGGYVMRHRIAMTVEALHSKSDIADELGWRDWLIADLTRERDTLRLDASRYSCLRDEGYLSHMVDVHPCDESKRPELIDKRVDSYIALAARKDTE